MGGRESVCDADSGKLPHRRDLELLEHAAARAVLRAQGVGVAGERLTWPRGRGYRGVPLGRVAGNVFITKKAML